MDCVGVVGTSRLDTLASFDVSDLLIHGKSIRRIYEGDSVPQKFWARSTCINKAVFFLTNLSNSMSSNRLIRPVPTANVGEY